MRKYLYGLGIVGSLLMTGMAAADEPDTRLTADQCHGKPNWCLKVSNETDTTVKVFIDGEDVWRMAPQEVDWFPLPAGTDHLVNVCLLFVMSADKCLAPEKIKADSDYLYVVIPQ